MKRLMIFAAGILTFFTLFAQVPQGFNYQAVVRNDQGELLAQQQVSIRISLQDETGAVTHYSETHSVTTSLQGVVNFVVGGGTVQSGVFTDIPWGDGNIHMKVEVDPTGGSSYTTLGVSQLQSVPYALYAANGTPGPQGPQGEQGEDGQSAYEIWLGQGNTGTVEDFLASLTGAVGPQGDQGEDGQSAYEIWLGQGNTGTVEDFLASLKGTEGPQGPQGEQGEQGPAGPQGPEGPLVAGEEGQTLRHSGTTWEASSNIYNTGTNVGIGTTSPTEKLHVEGNIRAHSLMLDKQGTPDEEPLFVVRNSEGQTVFAVYEQGVRIYVDGDPADEDKGNRSGFAIGGLTGLKDSGEEYFRVSRGYTQVMFDDQAKGNRSGFAIGGLTGLKDDEKEY
ncbi:MAG TPA: hypothetical protein PLA70_10725, partial [Tenuifilaceae bacterium]|nr:hypothetical protein [Tenuifilaceae bacterium]HPW50186.1 hypothetical protein [Tenuifilaceae bacterium]